MRVATVQAHVGAGILSRSHHILSPAPGGRIRIPRTLICSANGHVGRLLQDARYLHEKMSGLKHVGAPGRMLETVVLEKTFPGAAPVPAKQSRLSSRMAAVVAGAAGGTKEPEAKAVPVRQPEAAETPTPPPKAHEPGDDGKRDQDPGACLDRHAEP